MTHRDLELLEPDLDLLDPRDPDRDLLEAADPDLDRLARAFDTDLDLDLERDPGDLRFIHSCATCNIECESSGFFSAFW